MSSTFSYFAYGSNLLAHRIHINNPSAARAGIGKLEGYQLDFARFSDAWKGASATIVKQPGRHIWGALWEIDSKHRDTLDSQEGVNDNIYTASEVEVILPNGTIKKCRLYEQCDTPPATRKIESLADDRKPSLVYLNTILKGAKESYLPEDYQNFLKRIPHNGYSGEVSTGVKLDVVMD